MPDTIREFGLNSYSVEELIEKTGNIEKYLEPDIIREFGLNSDSVERLIRKTGEIVKYLTLEKVKGFGFTGKNIAGLLLGEYQGGIVEFIDNELNNETYDHRKIQRVGEIFSNFQDSNSERIARVATELALQIYTLPEKEQQNVVNTIKNIYLTTNLPVFAQNFLVFQQLHPNLMNEDSDFLYKDRSTGNIPSLLVATKTERSHIIFSDLLNIAIESNSRNLRDYLLTIEKGDQLFNKVKEGQLQIDDKLSESVRKTIKKYSEILNTLYNQTSKGKRQKRQRVNSGDLAQDLQELENLFTDNTNIHKSLPDRIVRMFGYWAGIRDFKQIKTMIEEKTKETDKRNKQVAKKQDFVVRKGDFVKGIQNTEFFPMMLQNGIVAKDYLGQDAASDKTPLDMDVELIETDGVIETAKSYINESADNRKLGMIILVIRNNGEYIKTREEYTVDNEAVKEVIHDKSKKEYFDNNGKGGINAYGIRTGIGSTNISYIISNRYVDKLGLEIAINGFYIPIVDEKGKLIFTPEMYEKYRSKMQGMSYYGVDEFNVDETARNEGTTQIAELIAQNKKEVSEKRQKILQCFNKAVVNCGLEMTDKRKLDLVEGFVEIIDTGSTGRGTNEPGDGDFDFMVRIDKNKMKETEKIKEELKKALTTVNEPDEGIITANGDLRYKGVTIEGLNGKVDIDMSFTTRTDELDYTTEESIIDRLGTIKKNNPEDYKYVVANIILAKKVLKIEGAYKKKNAPEPEQGKKDTRGGLGAVGIENWVLQNGGSFEKAARTFLSVAEECSDLSEFQQKYAIWDFGENYKAGSHYPHDNFVYNMDDAGYSKMKKALEDYIQALSMKKEKSEQKNTDKKSLSDIVQEDMSVLNDTTYMRAVGDLLSKVHRTKIYEINILK